MESSQPKTSDLKTTETTQLVYKAPETIKSVAQTFDEAFERNAEQTQQKLQIIDQLSKQEQTPLNKKEIEKILNEISAIEEDTRVL